MKDITPHGYAVERATVRQEKTGVPVRFEVTEQTRQAVDDYIRTAGRKPGDFSVRGANLGIKVDDALAITEQADV